MKGSQGSGLILGAHHGFKLRFRAEGMGVWGEGLECRRVQVLRFREGRSLKFALLICAGRGLHFA